MTNESQTTNPLLGYEITAHIIERGESLERCAVEIICKTKDEMWAIQNFLFGARDAE